MSEPAPNRAFLTLGSNIEPRRYLPAAVEQLSQFGNVVAVSNVWETAPVGFADQPNFLNAAMLLETSFSAAELRNDAIETIEQQLGRIRDPQNRNAPRTIDVDIALFNRDIFELGTRHIPDPDLLKHAFVAIPLAELDAQYIHPQTGQTLAEIASRLKTAISSMIPRPDVNLKSALVAHQNNRLTQAVISARRKN